MTKVSEAEILRHGHSCSQRNLLGYLPDKPLSQFRCRTAMASRYLPVDISEDLTMRLLALSRSEFVSSYIYLLRRCRQLGGSAKISNQE